jgi:NADH:ubiquinone oxidoreductase subunit 3 (subunit A)
MSLYLKEEVCLFYFFLMAGVLSAVILGASCLLSIQNGSTSKLSSYECGFDPFEDARNIFDVHFYLVAILFLVLDLEVLFLFPWSVSLGSIGLKGFFSMVVFIVILTVGFFYEWKLGALEWSLQKLSSEDKYDVLKRYSGRNSSF